VGCLTKVSVPFGWFSGTRPDLSVVCIVSLMLFSVPLPVVLTSGVLQADLGFVVGECCCVLCRWSWLFPYPVSNRVW
jgi:hypothetical protein